MAITATASLDATGHGTGVSRMMSRRVKVVRDLPRGWRGFSAVSADQASLPNAQAIRESGPVSPHGVIGAAVVQAARRSAHLTRQRLARLLNVKVATVRSRENGTIPLFSLPYSELQQLSETFSRAGARVGHELGELLLASRCDLLLTGMLHGFEDYAEVPPIEEDSNQAETARELLYWALAGAVPERYRPYAELGQLLAVNDIDLFAAVAQDLRSGMLGHDLAHFGSVLLTLADQSSPTIGGDTWMKPPPPDR
jgi:DNA-binding transcriptional regulator YiaG